MYKNIEGWEAMQITGEYEKHIGKFVAFHNGELVSVEDTGDKVYQVARKKFSKGAILTCRVTSEPEVSERGPSKTRGLVSDCSGLPIKVGEDKKTYTLEYFRRNKTSFPHVLNLSIMEQLH
jgi:hypothetical protein